MRILLRSVFLLLGWTLLFHGTALGQSTPGSAGAAFSCDGTFFIIRQVANANGIAGRNRTQLFRVNRNVTPAADPTTTPYTNTLVYDLGTGLGLPTSVDFVVNSLAYNPQDGYMYALTYPVNNTGFPVVNLYKIGQGGVEDLGAITIDGAVPSATTAGNPQLAAGVIDRNGIYYASPRNLASANYQRSLFRFDLKQITNAAKRNATLVPMLFYASTAPNTAINPTNTTDFSFIDLAIDPTDNALYGVYGPGTIYRFDFTATAGSVRVTRTGPAPSGTINLGSVIFDLAGNLYAYSNEGDFYSININTGAATDIGNVPTASVTDGASCVNPDQRIDVVKQVVSVASVNATTYDVSFAIRVKNTGTVTATNVQVSDFLRGAPNNTTFPTSTSVAVSGLTVTNTGGLLAANTAYDGQGANADLLTGNRSLTAGQSALITFTVRVVFGTVPSTVQNNTAYASSTAGTNANPGYALQTADGSLILPPGDLIALDQSTNSAALPLTPNGDTPSPSPVYFTPAILGNVFEDFNYGGGAGRSQATSNGAGVTGAVVELYNATTGTFITSATTDAAGNYVFAGPGVTASTSYRVRVVNSTVVSNRPGSIAGLLPVQTFINGDVNRVGGENPNQPDAAARSGTQTLLQVEAASGTTIQSLTPLTGSGSVAIPSSGPVVGVSFGFNFSTVVNTNDAGQGSLRQFILNSNALTNANLAQVSSLANVGTLTAGKEYAIFMLNDGRTTGTAPAGLRLGMTAPTSYTAATGFTFALASALPSITDDNTAIDGSLQEALTGNKVPANGELTTGPEITINFNNQKGLFVTGGNTLIRAIGLNNAKGSIGTTPTANITFSDGSGVTFSGLSASGSTVTLVTTSNNARSGIRLEQGVENISVTNNVLNGNTGATGGTQNADGLQLLGTTNATVTGNVINGNKGNGIFMTASANSGASIENNIIRNNGSGNTSAAIAGINIVTGTNTLVLGNTISGNTGDGIVALIGTASNRFSQNSISGNGDLGIDLSAVSGPGNGDGDGVTRNANTKAASGANGLLNFPIIYQATTFNGNLELTGYAPKGSTIEFFIADRTTAAFGQGQTYLFTAMEGGTVSGIADQSARAVNYGGLINGLDQGSETGASVFLYTIPLSNFTAAQRTALTNGTTRLTATATLNNATSEFSGNAPILLNTKPLPVTLVGFAAQAAGDDAKLSWKTVQELNNDHFVIERSFDGAGFVAVGQVKGQGTSSAVTTYQFTDAQAAAKAPNGLAYYRLRQVDTDGTESTSSVEVVRFPLAARTQVTVYPTPATSTQDAKLDLRGAAAGTYQVTLADLTGRVLRTFAQPGGSVRELDVASLPAGTYLVRVKGNGQSFTKRVVKQ